MHQDVNCYILTKSQKTCNNKYTAAYEPASSSAGDDSLFRLEGMEIMKQYTESQRARRREQKRRSYAKSRSLEGKVYIPKDQYQAAGELLKVTTEEEVRYRAAQRAREQTPEYQESMKILANALLGKKGD